MKRREVIQWLVWILLISSVLVLFVNDFFRFQWLSSYAASTTKTETQEINSQNLTFRRDNHRSMMHRNDKLSNDDVEMYAEKIKELKKQLEHLEQLMATHQLRSNSSSQTISDGDEIQIRRGHKQQTALIKSLNRPDGLKSTFSSSKNPFCGHMLPHPIPSAMELWSSQLGFIHNASRLPNDKNYAFSDFTAELLHLVSNRLPRSVKTIPHHWDSVQQILKVGYERWKYLNDISNLEQLPNEEKDNAPRKVKILIMGGSVLYGVRCNDVMYELRVNKDMYLRDRQCNWANRLGCFLNQMFGPVHQRHPVEDSHIWDLVQVTNVAMGGTNTQTGHTILEYDMLPTDARYPDIIINAYSTNDMHALTMTDAAKGNLTLRDKVFDMMQGFVRHVMGMQTTPPYCENEISDDVGNDRRQPNRPVPPLFVHMDDYLGNEQREIWATTELSQSVQVLANYYGFSSMSYADVVRDLVYGDTREGWFSPKGWWDANHPTDSKKMFREIHPSMGMHITSMWITAFSMLHLATTYCSLEWSQVETGSSESLLVHNDSETFPYSSLLSLPQLERLHPQVIGKPRRPPRDVLPPLLTKDLSLETITDLWRASPIPSNNTMTKSCRRGNDTIAVRCPFSWIANLDRDQNHVDFVRMHFKKYMLSNEGWDLEKRPGKAGYVPFRGKNSSMTLEFSNVTQPIRTVTIFYMKSYGAAWRNSQMNISAYLQVDANSEPLLQRALYGLHGKRTSETYTEPLQLDRSVNPGDTLQLRMKLVDGVRFKILGLAICS